MPLSKVQTTDNQVIPNLGRRNMVINGAMKVAQRATSLSGLGGNEEKVKVIDRIKHLSGGSSAGRYTASQETITDLPGFGKALKLACTTADTSIAAGEFFGISHFFEGQNVQSIQKGHSTAKPVTVSFYVKGNASATYTAELKDTDNSRINGKTFSVTTDWTRVSLTYPADTTGKLDNDNALSLTLSLYLHAGSTYTGGTFTNGTWASEVQANRISSSQSSFYDSTSRTFFITGLQLEVGSVATDFEHRSISEELDSCHRYFYKPVTADVGNYSPFLLNFGNTVSTGSNGYFAFNVPLPKPMRAIPTFTHNLSNSNHAGSGTGANVGNWQFYWQNQGWGNYAGSGNMNTLNRAMSGTTSVHLGNYYITPSTTYFDQITVGRDLTFQFESEL